METNKEFESRLTIPKAKLWSTMISSIDPRRTTSTFSPLRRVDPQMSLTSMKANIGRTVTQTATNMRTASRLGSHPYLSTTLSLNNITKEAEVMKLKTDINRLEGLLEESKVKLSQKSIEYELQIESLNKDIEREKRKSSEVEKQKKTFEQKCEDLSVQLNNAREEYTQEYDRYEKIINELNRTIVEVKNELSDSLSATDSIKAGHHSEVVALETQIQSLESQLNQCLEERQLLDNQIQSLRIEAQEKNRMDTELTSVKTDLVLLSKELQSYKDGVKLSSILENEMKELKVLRERNKDLIQTNEMLSEVHSKNLILAEQIIGLQSQLKSANDTIKQTDKTDIELYIQRILK